MTETPNAVPQTSSPMHTIEGHDEAARTLSIAIGRLKAAHAKAGLPTYRIVQVLRDALAEEERLLAQHHANQRSYR